MRFDIVRKYKFSDSKLLPTKIIVVDEYVLNLISATMQQNGYSTKNNALRYLLGLRVYGETLTVDEIDYYKKVIGNDKEMSKRIEHIAAGMQKALLGDDK